MRKKENGFHMVSPQIPGGDQQRRHWEGEAGMAIDCTSKAAQWENKLRDLQLWDWDYFQTSETSHGNSQKWAPKEWFYCTIYIISILIIYLYFMCPLFGPCRVPNSEKSLACREALPEPPPKPGLSWEHRSPSVTLRNSTMYWLVVEPYPSEKWWSE